MALWGYLPGHCCHLSTTHRNAPDPGSRDPFLPFCQHTNIQSLPKTAAASSARCDWCVGLGHGCCQQTVYRKAKNKGGDAEPIRNSV